MTLGFSHVPRQWLRLTWPREMTVDQASAALRALNGLSAPRRSEATVLQVVGTSEGIEHHLAVPEPRAEATSRNWLAVFLLKMSEVNPLRPAALSFFTWGTGVSSPRSVRYPVTLP